MFVKTLANTIFIHKGHNFSKYQITNLPTEVSSEGFSNCFANLVLRLQQLSHVVAQHMGIQMKQHQPKHKKNNPNNQDEHKVIINKPNIIQ